MGVGPARPILGGRCRAVDPAACTPRRGYPISTPGCPKMSRTMFGEFVGWCGNLGWHVVSASRDRIGDLALFRLLFQVVADGQDRRHPPPPRRLAHATDFYADLPPPLTFGAIPDQLGFVGRQPSTPAPRKSAAPPPRNGSPIAPWPSLRARPWGSSWPRPRPNAPRRFCRPRNRRGKNGEAPPPFAQASGFHPPRRSPAPLGLGWPIPTAGVSERGEPDHLLSQPTLFACRYQ